jgi:hypothetical protein
VDPRPALDLTLACCSHYKTQGLLRMMSRSVIGLVYFLSILVKVAFNKKAFKPPVSAIKDKYYEMLRGKGNLEEEIEDSAPAAAAAVASAQAGAEEAGPSS